MKPSDRIKVIIVDELNAWTGDAMATCKAIIQYLDEQAKECSS